MNLRPVKSVTIVASPSQGSLRELETFLPQLNSIAIAPPFLEGRSLCLFP
ncbi:MAG: hypothetical protein SXA11_23740 [Cyanobacteriota bacterium]|nr:hypothetical protein [Cyanobacteriota bacterium]